MDIPLWTLLLALPVTGVFVLVAPPAAMAQRGRWPKAAVVLWVSGLLLLMIWLTMTMQAAVQADESGGRGNVFSDIGWLVLAGFVGAVSLATARRGGRHNSARRS